MKWAIQNNNVASLMLKNTDDFLTPLKAIMEGKVPYSGIVITSNENVFSGEVVEKNCYEKGGFKFLYRSYLPDKDHIDVFPVDKFKTLLENIGFSYSSNVLGGSQECFVEAFWGVSQLEGDYGTIHNHVSYSQDQRGNMYSGMLYLEVPETINSNTFPDGCLHIVENNNVLYIPPIKNSIVVWPAKLMHGIHPFRGAGNRIGIAFNIVLHRSDKDVH